MPEYDYGDILPNPCPECHHQKVIYKETRYECPECGHLQILGNRCPECVTLLEEGETESDGTWWECPACPYSVFVPTGPL